MTWWMIAAAVVLLICGLGFLRLIFQGIVFVLGIIFSALLILFKAICVLIGLLAATIYLLLKKLIPVVATALPHIISSAIIILVASVAIIRRTLSGDDALDFVETMLPKKEFPRRSDFVSALMELKESLHTEIVKSFEMHYREKFTENLLRFKVLFGLS